MCVRVTVYSVSEPCVYKPPSVWCKPKAMSLLQSEERKKIGKCKSTRMKRKIVKCKERQESLLFEILLCCSCVLFFGNNEIKIGLLFRSRKIMHKPHPSPLSESRCPAHVVDLPAIVVQQKSREAHFLLRFDVLCL
ncbi:hypothetical protein DL89DRAFT_36403 [Linderina pennispora]|uniref:Uncharacterized protein n=1 Tax=Linderina pennispora TaxID=61395 RepID=A0A1Y1W3A4_9FUNG|nr:uncharacterized protein DL89DRAFT_36403 [Linderina pennispora]ORX67775.1 hypothetical protein DL89DRAFT_36403 [Linderina pennispora]